MKTTGPLLLLIEDDPQFRLLLSTTLESDITEALDNGADDYLTKPFSTAELMSRIKALLRRVAKLPGGAQEYFQVSELKIELTKRRVYVGEQEIHLTPIEFRLLCVLVHNAGFVVTHRQLLEKVWGFPISNIATT